MHAEALGQQLIGHEAKPTSEPQNLDIPLRLSRRPPRATDEDRRNPLAGVLVLTLHPSAWR
jgi:hypothetical protein